MIKLLNHKIIKLLVKKSYLNEGQLTTDQDTRKLGHIFIIPFPVLCKCRYQLKRTKTTKILSKDDIKRAKTT